MVLACEPTQPCPALPCPALLILLCEVTFGKPTPGQAHPRHDNRRHCRRCGCNAASLQVYLLSHPPQGPLWGHMPLVATREACPLQEPRCLPGHPLHLPRIVPHKEYIVQTTTQQRPHLLPKSLSKSEIRAWTSPGAWCQPNGTLKKPYVRPWAATRIAPDREGRSSILQWQFAMSSYVPHSPPPHPVLDTYPRDLVQVPEEDCQALEGGELKGPRLKLAALPC